MATLLKKPIQKNMAKGVTLIHDVNKANTELEYVGFKIIDLETQGVYEEILTDHELCIVALTGQITVSDSNETFEGVGTRNSVFDRKPTDSVYVSHNKTVKITGNTKARVALCYAPSHRELPTKLIKAADNGVEHRGKYHNKRQVHNILPDSDPAANSLLVVEVFTETANWSSYPPHKHDQDNLPEESFLEESYYHEIDPPQGFVFQRVYTEDRSLDETMAVENSNVVLVPKGYHPVGVPDGYASYYLNVMAGPKRIWKFHNEKDHEWIINRE
ncbi:5-deoxy-glucuronate isomerase [Gracilibacillus timonensis]|uniref:5-deoxy-glucuronate isomerase n=1 Tax=Gracilibacillus timonensis TaxID=1816696 RepID=UPI000826EFC4|nr:5-deoxy-glucuronate isomerase [Gracilibacillus timonensis]